MEKSGKSIVETIEFEVGQSKLSEAQEQAIADEALREIREGKTDSEDNWVNPADEEAERLLEEEAAREAEEKAKLEKSEEDKDTADLEAKEKEEAEAKRLEQETQEETDARLKKEKVEADKKTADEAAAKVVSDNKTFKIADSDRAKAIEELALKESLTLKEAEEQIVKDEATINKYKQNPIEMARALRHSQREMDRVKTELDATRKAAGKPPAPVLNNVRDYVETQIQPIKDKLIPLYRKENPELTDDMTDDKVYGLIKKDAIERTTKILEENESKITSSAKEKKAELIMGLADEDKAFLPDIKAALDRTNARQLLDKEFDIKEVIYWAKGRQLDRIKKEEYDRGYKQGKEQSKILGEKTPSAGNRQASGGGSKGGSGSRLSDEQKERALDMFDGAEGMADEDKFAAYIDTYPEEFKK